MAPPTPFANTMLKYEAQVALLPWAVACSGRVRQCRRGTGAVDAARDAEMGAVKVESQSLLCRVLLFPCPAWHSEDDPRWRLSTVSVQHLVGVAHYANSVYRAQSKAVSRVGLMELSDAGAPRRTTRGTAQKSTARSGSVSHRPIKAVEVALLVAS